VEVAADRRGLLERDGASRDDETALVDDHARHEAVDALEALGAEDLHDGGLHGFDRLVHPLAAQGRAGSGHGGQQEEEGERPHDFRIES
jgi:hypothetical protein